MKKIDKELFKNVRLLYVEDDEMTSEEISFFLKKYVKELYIAKNGFEGIELFSKYKPDMVITDIQMPKMNGLEMSEKIIEISPDVPIALTTAYSDSNYIMKAIELGIDKYIVKPINMQEILAVIHKSLNLESKKQDEHYDDYIQFILDSNPTFMFILHSNEVEYANKKFLELLGHDDVKSLQEHVDSCQDLFKIHGIETDKNWLDYVVEHEDGRHLLELKKTACKRYLTNQFYVTYKHFDSTNKSVFVFSDANEEKLNKINNIVNKLIENEDNSSLKKELEEILKLSKVI